MPTVRLDQGTWNASLSEAIAKRDTKRIGALVDHARAAGMNYNDIASRATTFGKIDAAEWESLLYEVDTEESED